VKTEAAIRRVPIHTKLIEVGFLAYVEARRQAASGAIQAGRKVELFPRLQAGHHRGKGDSFSKQWARLLDRLGITDRSKTAHSLRHNVRTRLLGLVDRPLVDALVGHDDDSNQAIYEHRDFIPIKLLRDAVQKLDYGKILEGLPSQHGGNHVERRTSARRTVATRPIRLYRRVTLGI
jgi:integrase